MQYTKDERERKNKYVILPLQKLFIVTNEKFVRFWKDVAVLFRYIIVS